MCFGSRRVAHAGGSGVHCRADPGAVGAVALVELRGRARRSHAGAGGDAGSRVSSRQNRRSGAPGPPGAFSRTGRPADHGAAVGEGLSAAAVPERVRRRPSARLAGSHDVPAATCRRRPSARWRQGLHRLNRRGLEAALVALDPSTGDILAMVGGADYGRSTFNRATAQPAPAGIGVQAARLRRGAGARILAGVGPVEPRSRCSAPDRSRMEPAQCRSRTNRRADAARGTARIEQRGRRGSAAARGLARRPAARRRCRA